MISGAHVIIFSKNAESDRKFFRDTLNLPHVDAGEGWLIFALPPAELAVHPAEKNGPHELYLLCDDLKATLKELRKKKIACSAPAEQSWGKIVEMTLPGGGRLGLYQPKHPLAINTKKEALRILQDGGCPKCGANAGAEHNEGCPDEVIT